MGFHDAAGRALHGLEQDTSDDIVVRIDDDGFIIHASANARVLGVDFSSLLLMPHVSDLAAQEFASEVAAYCEAVLAGEKQGGWLEFPLILCAERSATHEDGGSVNAQTHWYALSLRKIAQDDGASQGAVGILRSVQHKHALAQEMGEQSVRDPVTGLANRHALCASLKRMIGAGPSSPYDTGTIAIFAIDRMRAIFMQYGQSTADEIRWGFGRYLGTMTSPPHELAQLDDERFGVILKGMTIREAREWASDVLKTFGALTMASPGRAPELTASAGLARVELSVDWTLRQAELGLVMARAGGGMQVGVCRNAKPAVSTEPVERAMEAALQRVRMQVAQRPIRRSA